MKDRKSYSIDYRLVINGKTQYYRMLVRKTADGTHFIIGVENIDKEVRKEKKALRELNSEKELARKDELTGIKNKTAYRELEKSVQANMDSGMDYLTFAILVCDANDLKKINDSHGHVAGEDTLKAASVLWFSLPCLSTLFCAHTSSGRPSQKYHGSSYLLLLRPNIRWL